MGYFRFQEPNDHSNLKVSVKYTSLGRCSVSHCSAVYSAIDFIVNVKKLEKIIDWFKDWRFEP